MSDNSYDNSGALFKNNRKQEGSKQPDYRGDIKINGKEMQISGWIRSGKNGSFLSLKVSEKYRRDEDGGQQPKPRTADEDIPF